MPMKPVSRMMSRMSVKGTRGKEFQRFAPRAHLRFRLAGRRVAARARPAAMVASAVRRVMEFMMTGRGRLRRRGRGSGVGGRGKTSGVCGFEGTNPRTRKWIRAQRVGRAVEPKVG